MAKVLAVLRKSRQTKRFQRSVYLLPSMFTVGTLFCGYSSIVSAMRADYAMAAVFIGVATVLDVLDGRIARLAGAASEFGGEFDSLADVISFGVAPAVLAFAWALEPLGRLGWAAGFLYVTATALRLARFNVQNQIPDKRYFVGMPSPGAAGVLASAGIDSTLLVWDLEAKKPKTKTTLCHTEGGINKVCWVDDSTIATAGSDACIKTWSA